MSKIFVQPPDAQSFDEFLTFATIHGYNLEIASFAYNTVLDTNWQEIVKDHKQKLQDFKGTISVHGAYLDLLIHSRDEKIRKVAKNRIFQNLEIAKELNASFIVFHGNFNPLIKHESYRRNWIEQNAQFWSEVLDTYTITVLLENLWEPAPHIFREVLDLVKSPHLRICFDTGHAHIFSEVPFEEWVSVLQEDIGYIHVNDNNKDVDSELVPGDGTIDWQEFSHIIIEYEITPEIVFEVGTLENTMRSLTYFKERGIYPFRTDAVMK